MCLPTVARISSSCRLSLTASGFLRAASGSGASSSVERRFRRRRDEFCLANSYTVLRTFKMFVDLFQHLVNVCLERAQLGLQVLDLGRDALLVEVRHHLAGHGT